MIIGGALSLHTGRYRATEKIELGSILGINSSLHDFIHLKNALETIQNYDLIIVHRAAYHKTLEDLIVKAHKLGKIVVFDIDDLIFDVRDLEHVKARKTWSPAVVAAFDEGFVRYRKSLELCDVAIVSTDYLAGRIQKDFGITAFTLRYNLSQELIDISLNAAKISTKSKRKFRIGYFAGSPVHDENFLVAADGLLEVLKENPSVELFIGGYLNLDKRFSRFAKQVRRSQFVDWRKLPYVMASCDVIIAPLENNPHNRSKAETKYIESGILGVPLVASPLDSFKLCIHDGHNGFLARNPLEWKRKIERLIKNRQLALKMGKRAQQHVLRNYSPESRSRDYQRILEVIFEMNDLRTRKFPIDYVNQFDKIGSGILESPGIQPLAHQSRRSSAVGVTVPAETSSLPRAAWYVLTQEGIRPLLRAAFRLLRITILEHIRGDLD
jgi:glycosyltransferase involved in cell wall biosynthesis